MTVKNKISRLIALLVLVSTQFVIGFSASAQSYGSPISSHDFITNEGGAGSQGAPVRKVGDANSVMNKLISKGFTRQGKSYQRVSNGDKIDVYIVYDGQRNPGYAIEFSNPQDALNFDKTFKGYLKGNFSSGPTSYKRQPITSYLYPPKTGKSARNKKGFVYVQKVGNWARILYNGRD
ncbi:MAG: hypothetical protein K2N05_05980 [Muribaculaceae bacterium]|nr:hypothetical protein [Muribaculaceae bacterium]